MQAKLEATASFEVTLVDLGEERSWRVDANNPSDALSAVLGLSGSRTGIYSVWDPQDPHGMPVVEQTIG